MNALSFKLADIDVDLLLKSEKMRKAKKGEAVAV